MTVKVSGIAEINEVLGAIAPRNAINLMRATVYDIASQAAKRAAGFTPDDPSTTGGDLKSSIKPKREKGSRRKVEASVQVTNIRRNYFWRFLEYGQGPDNVEHAMFLKALETMRPEISAIYCEAFTKKLVASLARARKRAG